jgi:hypothetical protein
VTAVSRSIAADTARLAARWRSSPPRGKRAELAYDVVRRVAALTDAPFEVPWVDNHVLGDQLSVVVHDLLAGDPTPDQLAAAAAELDRVR